MTTENSTPSSGARARGIDRAIELLECLHLARMPLRIGELAKRLKAPRSTVYEIVNRFLEAGILETYDAEGRVFFGRTVHFYATDYLGTHDLARRAREEVARLAVQANETTQYCALHGNKYTVLHAESGAKMFRIASDIGLAVPIPWTASGRLLLGHMSVEEIRAFIPAEDFILPDGRRIDIDTFHAEVAQAKRDGYCITSGLVDSFTHCLAAPVTDAAGIAVATMCFVVTADTSPDERLRLAGLLVDSGRSLSRYLAQTTPLPSRAAE